MNNPVLIHDRQVRWLHPVAWWAWAIGCAAAASITREPLLMIGTAIAALLVMLQRGTSAPWAAAVGTMLRIAVLLILLRITLQTLLGAPVGTHVLLRLPSLALPDWLTGVRLGGVLTVESVAIGAVEGLRFSAILLCVAAATTVAAPSRLLRALPSRISDVGTLLIVAATLVPHLVQDFRRIRAARRLRGRSVTGVRAAAASLTPVIDAALERSMLLAASMTSRGYGSTRATRYRPDPWNPAEWLVAGSGLVLLLAAVADGALGRAGFSVTPLTWPTLSPWSWPALATAMLPAYLTPLTPDTAEVM